MNILLTLNKNYLPYLISLIRSYNDYNKRLTHFYLFSNDIKIKDIYLYSKYLSTKNIFHIIKIPENAFADAPIKSRYPREMYYRIFASKFLPSNIDKILYLDPDIIIKGNIIDLYNLDIKDYFFAGASNVTKLIKKVNQIKNGASKNCEYINTGVLLINLKALRKNQTEKEVYDFIKEKKHLLTLPDQDIISALYGEKILLIDKFVYNLSDRTIMFHNLKCFNDENKIDLSWVEKNTKIIHYFGKNKPWRKNYRGILDIYYNRYKVQ